MRAIETAPLRDVSHPPLRHLAQHVESGTDVGAPLRVVRRGRQERERPARRARRIRVVQRLDGVLERRPRIPADLVPRRERDPAVERRILHPFRHDRAGHLLEAVHESPRGCTGALSTQERREELERRRRHPRRAARFVERRLDRRALRIARTPRLGQVRPVHRERDHRRLWRLHVSGAGLRFATSAPA